MGPLDQFLKLQKNNRKELKVLANTWRTLRLKDVTLK
jgi:hypothetical protein